MKAFFIHNFPGSNGLPAMVFMSLLLMLTSCSTSEEFPLPLNPVEKYALPRSTIVLTITPNPTGTGQVTQTWIIREINDVGMRIDSIRINTHTASGAVAATRKLLEADVQQLWESTYIPPLWSGAGTRQAEITGESGGRIFIMLYGHDDNQYRVTAADTLAIL